MRLYDANRPCAKCGYTNVLTIYRPPLRMERRCGRCSHVWFEKPLDAADRSLDVAEAPATDAKGTEGIGTKGTDTKGIGIFRMNPRD